MIFFFCFCLFIFSFLSFACLFCLFLFCGCWFCFYFLLVYFLLCAFKFVFFFFSFPSLFILRSVFILLCVGLGLIFRCLENKISYLGVVYKFLSMGMELAVIKKLFIVLYIFFLTNLLSFFYSYLLPFFLKFMLCFYICLCNIFSIHICFLLMCCYQYVVMCFSVCDCNLNVYVWDPQTMRARSYLTFTFLGIMKKN